MENKNNIKNAQTTTFGNLKVGDKVFHLQYEISNGGYLEYQTSTVESIEETKSGKRIKIVFRKENGSINKTRAVSRNTIINETPQEWLEDKLKNFPLINEKPN